MARKARIRAVSGIYYVRLNSFSPLFLQERDLTELLNLLTTEKETDFCDIYAYCLIDCEAHLVIKEGLSGISANIMRIKSAFASYYNTIYVRKGALFKDRFHSEPLEDNFQVLKAVRRVHRIPLKFGYKTDFEGSSYSEYFKNRPLLSSAEIIALYKSGVDFKIDTETDQPDANKQDNTGSSQLNNTDPSQTESTSEIAAEPNNSDSQTGTTGFSSDPDEALRVQIKTLLKDVSAEELEALTEQQYKLLINRIIRLTNSTPQAVARVLEIDEGEI